MKKIEKKIKEKSESKNDPFLIARWISAFLTGEPTKEEKEELGKYQAKKRTIFFF